MLNYSFGCVKLLTTEKHKHSKGKERISYRLLSNLKKHKLPFRLYISPYCAYAGLAKVFSHNFHCKVLRLSSLLLKK